MITRIKNKIYAIVFWQTFLGDFVNQLYDLKMFYKYSFGKENKGSKKQIEYFLRKQFHIIEKGLSLPNPRPGFGKAVINKLIVESNQYFEKYGSSDVLESISSCLNEYLDFNKNHNENISNEFYTKIRKFIDIINKNNFGGTKLITKKQINAAIDFDFSAFIKTRTSVRDFSSINVDINIIKESVDLAKYAPSVCNRQAWKVHEYSDKNEIDQLLILQNGSRGFADSINKLLVVTGDTRGFTKLESNQIFIDGGIFAMNLLLSLHAKGLGAIALNTCFPFTTEKKVKAIGNMKPYERIILMIGVGNIKDSFKVASSKRKNTSLVYEKH